MEYVVSVSKKGKNVWKIYGYDFNEEDQLIFSSERINPLLIWYYKLKKHRRQKMICYECNRVFTWVHKWYEKTCPESECPYCYV